MHVDTGKIEWLDVDQVKELENSREERDTRLFDIEQKLVALSTEEAEECSKMPNYQRKGWMRNKPCVCGSGRKFKKCFGWCFKFALICSRFRNHQRLSFFSYGSMK